MRNLFLTFGLLLTAVAANAIDTPDVLPKGVRGAVIKYGAYEGLDEYYSEAGSLKYLSDKNSVELSVENLESIDARISDLKRILNEYGHANLGNELHLGQLKVDSEPSISFFAPILLYGATKKWSTGIAIPVVTYVNNIKATNTGSNLSEIQSLVGPNSPDELSDAFGDLNTAITAGVNGALKDAGYKPLENKDETFLGDVQLLNFYTLSESPEFKSGLRSYLSLPTGPKADPDDVADVENFGRYSLKMEYLAQIPAAKRLDLVGGTSYTFFPEQGAVKRVPRNEDDALPNSDQKYKLGQDLGDVVSVGAAAILKLDESIKLGSGYNYEYKFEDKYSGAPDGRNRYLEGGTEKSAHLLKLEAGYSSVSKFLKKQALAPFIVSYQMTRTLSGTNVENQTRHELTFQLFF